MFQRRREDRHRPEKGEFQNRNPLFSQKGTSPAVQLVGFRVPASFFPIKTSNVTWITPNNTGKTVKTKTDRGRFLNLAKTKKAGQNTRFSYH